MTQELNGFLSVSVGLMMKAEKTLKVNLLHGRRDGYFGGYPRRQFTHYFMLVHRNICDSENLILPLTTRKNGSSRSQSCNAFGSTNQLALHHVFIQI